ncbi:MAG: TonB-dependent receptor [Bryobacteraceae bacterium]
MAFRRISGFILLGISLRCVGQTPQAPAPAAAPLADASLEDLMNVEVTSASKKVQRLGSTAASVYVISAEDIRRSGISILPELLRLAPGVQVSRLSSGSWAISIRGFNDEYSNKLLVLVDGRSVYNEFYACVFWDTLNLVVEDIERIEVIRGPGAAMWGTNAVNGVINIITKSAQAAKGGSITGGGGSEAMSAGSVRYGGEASPGAFYRIGAQNTDYEPFQILSSPSPSHGWVNRSADFRLDWDISSNDSLLVSGGIYQSSLGTVVPAATIASPNAPPADDRIDTDGGNVLVRWQHIVSETSSIEVNFSAEHMLRNDPQAEAGFNTFNAGFQQHVHAGSRHDVIYGVTVREVTLQTTPTAALRFIPGHDSHSEIALFAQDEIALVPNKLSFIAGVQASLIESLGYAIQPTARLLWTPSASLSSWIAVSRANRMPSLYDRGLDYYEAPISIPSGSPYVPSLLGIINVMGNPTNRSETVLAYEAGQRVQANKKISFDVSTFYNVYQHLVSATQGVPVLSFASGIPYLAIPVYTGNERHGESYGAELSTTWNVTSRWRLTAGYNWLRVETQAYAGDTNLDEDRTSSATPHHQWQVRSNFDLTRTIQIDTAFYYTAAMLETGIPQHLRGDLRIGWRPFPKIEFSIGVQDAFEANHVEYESSRFDQISEVPRNFYGKGTWRF